MSYELRLDSIDDVQNAIRYEINAKIDSDRFEILRRITGLNLLLKIAHQRNCAIEIIKFIQYQICSLCIVDISKCSEKNSFCAIDEPAELTLKKANLYKNMFPKLFNQLELEAFGLIKTKKRRGKYKILESKPYVPGNNKRKIEEEVKILDQPLLTLF